MGDGGWGECITGLGILAWPASGAHGEVSTLKSTTGSALLFWLFVRGFQLRIAMIRRPRIRGVVREQPQGTRWTRCPATAWTRSRFRRSCASRRTEGCPSGCRQRSARRPFSFGSHAIRGVPSWRVQNCRIFLDRKPRNSTAPAIERPALDGAFGALPDR